MCSTVNTVLGPGLAVHHTIPIPVVAPDYNEYLDSCFLLLSLAVKRHWLECAFDVTRLAKQAGLSRILHCGAWNETEKRKILKRRGSMVHSTRCKW